jgi:hyperosmotically inducible protein
MLGDELSSFETDSSLHNSEDIDMKNLLFVLTLTTLLVGCSSNGYDNSTTNKDTTKPAPVTQPVKTEPKTSENTKVSQQDQVTPIDQGENEADLTVTQNIRQALIDDDSLTLAAKNVTIVTTNNEVTLRGEVNTAAEKKTIGVLAAKNSAGQKVTNLLTVATKK